MNYARNGDESLDNFKVPTSDDKGHNVHMTFRCLPTWPGHMDQILHSQKFPYVSRGDFLKHAVLRHFEYLEQLEEIPGSILGQIQVMIDLLEDDARQQGFERVMEGLRERVHYHMNNGDLGQARRHILQAMRCVEEMPTGFWREKFQRTLRDSYRDILNTAPKARLNRIVDDAEEAADGK